MPIPKDYRYLGLPCIFVSTLPPAPADRRVVHDSFAVQEFEAVFLAGKSRSHTPVDGVQTRQSFVRKKNLQPIHYWRLSGILVSPLQIVCISANNAEFLSQYGRLFLFKMTPEAVASQVHDRHFAPIRVAFDDLPDGPQRMTIRYAVLGDTYRGCCAERAHMAITTPLCRKDGAGTHSREMRISERQTVPHWRFIRCVICHVVFTSTSQHDSFAFDTTNLAACSCAGFLPLHTTLCTIQRQDDVYLRALLTLPIEGCSNP